MASVSFSATNTWQCPSGVSSVTVECWGGGGAGGGANSTTNTGGGGGGGAYSKSVLTLTPGTIYTVTVGAGGVGVSNANGGVGGDSWFSTTGTILAKGGGAGLLAATGGSGGASGSGVGTTVFSGGNGGTSSAGPSMASGAGGGSAGSTSIGGNGTTGTGGAGSAGTGGGAAGAAGLVAGTSGAGNAGNFPGSGGGGATTTATARAGGNGGSGQVIVTFADTASYPNLIASYVVLSTAANIASLVTQTFTPTNGEVLVIKAVCEGSVTVIGAASGGSQTYTTQVTDSTASTSYTKLYTAVISGSPSNMAVTVAFSGTTGWHSMVVERWGNAQLAGTPATCDTRGTGSPTTTLSTVANNSIVSWSNGDFSAKAPTSRVYSPAAFEDGLHDKSTSNYVGYYAYQNAATAGSQTIGLSAPGTQTYKIVGIEIQSTSIPPPVTNTGATLLMMGI